MITFINKEQLLHFMSKGAVKMSNQDAHFFQNLHGLINRKQQVTSNQVTLFNKLIVKYKNQLKRRGIQIADLLDLPWKTSVIDSEKTFTMPNLRLVNGTLLLRTPYKNKFVKEFNMLKHNPFEWDSGARNYQAPLSTHSLKVAISTVNKHFDDLELSPEVEEIVSQFPDVQAKFWKPTLTKTNHYYIAASNHIIDDLSKNIEFNDDPKTFYALSKLGVNIDPKLIGEDKFAKFAAHYYNELSVSSTAEVDKVANELSDWLNTLNIRTVVFGRGSAFTHYKGYLNSMAKVFSKHNISCVNLKTTLTEERVLLTFAKEYGSTGGTQGIVKKIIIKDSKPIKI